MSMSPVHSSRARAVVRLVLAGLLGIVVLVCSAGPAAAHASLIDTDPADGAVVATAPEQVRFTFDEPVRLQDDAVHLFNAAGEEIPVQARLVDTEVLVGMPGGLEDGTYVVSWRVVSTDSHPIGGSLSFSIGAPSAHVAAVPQDQAGAAVISLHGITQGTLYLGLLASAGLVLFLVFFLPGRPGLEDVRRRVRRVVVLGAVVAVTGAVLLLPVTAVYQQGLGLSGLLSAKPWLDQLVSGNAVVTVLVAAGLGAALAVFAVGGHAPLTGWRRVVVLGGAFVPLAALSLVGHTRAYGPVPLVMVTDMLHAATAAVWFGGLLGLTLTLPALADRERIAAGTLARFSTAAAGLLVLLTLTGTIQGWRILGSWAALVTTGYGVVLLTKLGLVALAIAVAAWNRYRLLPRIHGARKDRDNKSPARLLQIAVRTEAILLVVVLVLTGFLVNRSPEPSAQAAEGQAAAEPATLTATAGDVRVVVHVRPQRIGRNTIVVHLQDSAGDPLEPYATPRVSIRSSQVDLGSRPVTNIATGTYRLQAVIPTAGQWEIQVSVRTSEFDNPVVTLPMPIPQPP